MLRRLHSVLLFHTVRPKTATAAAHIVLCPGGVPVAAEEAQKWFRWTLGMIARQPDQIVDLQHTLTAVTRAAPAIERYESPKLTFLWLCCLRNLLAANKWRFPPDFDASPEFCSALISIGHTIDSAIAASMWMSVALSYLLRHPGTQQSVTLSFLELFLSQARFVVSPLDFLIWTRCVSSTIGTGRGAVDGIRSESFMRELLRLTHLIDRDKAVESWGILVSRLATRLKQDPSPTARIDFGLFSSAVAHVVQFVSTPLAADILCRGVSTWMCHHYHGTVVLQPGIEIVSDDVMRSALLSLSRHLTTTPAFRNWCFACTVSFDRRSSNLIGVRDVLLKCSSLVCDDASVRNYCFVIARCSSGKSAQLFASHACREVLVSFARLVTTPTTAQRFVSAVLGCVRSGPGAERFARVEVRDALRLVKPLLTAAGLKSLSALVTTFRRNLGLDDDRAALFRDL